LSGGIDIIWRKRVVAELKKHQPKSILDIATGTADLAIAESVLNSVEIVGVDISEGMLNIGREKIKKLKLEKYIRLEYGDSENLLR
jgi:demethylmenaquinone methyltransferase/2-methoxy-6-polyprenyl-1,4-benzoquinol methylase